MKKIDLTSRVFGNLTVISEQGRNKHYGVMWNCLCACGESVVVCGDNLKCGGTKSCGCLKETKKGMTRDRNSLYSTWRGMMRRCYEPSHIAYKNYGARGITVCERWHDFLNFNADLGSKPHGKTLDRINNNQGYSPDNCKWSSVKEQSNNRTSNIVIEYGEEKRTASQWAEVFGIPFDTFRQRIKAGYPMPMALLNISFRGSL